VANGIANGLRGGLGNVVGGLGLGIFEGISGGIAESIGEGIGNALGGGWRGRDWDDYWRKLAVDGVDTTQLPSVEAVMAYTESLRTNIANAAKVEESDDD
jgi:hypothetical protein